VTHSAWRRVRRAAGVVIVLLPHWTGAAAEVVLEGVDDAQRSNILAHLRLDDEPCDAPEWRVRQAFRNAPESMEDALLALGYYTPAIEGALEFRDGCWTARFEIDPGSAVTIRMLDLVIEGEARDDPEFAALRAEFPLLPGNRLDHGSYERWKRALLDRARQRGFPRAAFSTARIDVYPDFGIADVNLRFDSGPRYRFGTIDLQQDVLTEELVLAYVDFERGDPYDAQRLADLFVALNESGYFETIDVRALEPDPVTREIPIAIALRPGRRLLVTYGVGFSTDIGPRLRYGRANRRVNAEGHQSGVNLQLSPVLSEATWSYRFPHGDPRSEWIGFTAGLKREDTESAFSESAEFEARRTLLLRRDWTFSQALNYLTEDYEVAEETGRSRLLMPGLLWSRLRADSPVRPTRGSRIDLELRGASDAVGSDTSFAQAVTSVKWIWSQAPSGSRPPMSSTTCHHRYVSSPAATRAYAATSSSRSVPSTPTATLSAARACSSAASSTNGPSASAGRLPRSSTPAMHPTGLATSSPRRAPDWAFAGAPRSARSASTWRGP
jgi:translocation and assembly module TamA